MAELNTSNRKHTKKIFVKKRTHVDLTAMVDLGFLLLTFFVFTTTMSKATAMDMLVPNDKDSSTSPVCESCALTVLLGKNDQVLYYEGKEETAVYKQITYSGNAIRNLIMQKKKMLLEKDPKLTLQMIIKPSPWSSFKNLVDVIDEANICTLKRYFITEPNDRDIEKLR